MPNFKLTNVDASPCILKNESDASRPVSIIFTRTPNGSNNYVHVLRCPACDFLTLILSTLREHVKTNHPTLESITLLSCSQCGSISTERNLLEEHMKLYHFNSETSSYKFLETRQAINSESAATTSLTIPLTISPPSATVSGLRIGLASPQPATTNSPSNSNVSCTTAQQALPPQSSSPPIITSTQRSTSSSHPSAQADSISQAPERSTATIQGSRRRKATNPGKIPAAALAQNGEGEDIVEQVSKRMKLEKTPESNRDETKTSGVTLNKTSSSHATMVCSMNGIMEALKNQQLANPITENSTASTSSTAPTSTPASKVTTAIMMDANSAKNLVNQLLAAAAAGQGKIEVSGAGVAMSASAATTTATHLSADQALDMSSLWIEDGAHKELAHSSYSPDEHHSNSEKLRVAMPLRLHKRAGGGKSARVLPHSLTPDRYRLPHASARAHALKPSVAPLRRWEGVRAEMRERGSGGEWAPRIGLHITLAYGRHQQQHRHHRRL
ncbi:hypothetical protein Aperf_G00000008263 [Anoplocephala perfoliata]